MRIYSVSMEFVLKLCRVQIVKDGRKRKLIFKEVKITDAGMIKCTTNSDETVGELVVECKRKVRMLNSFRKMQQFMKVSSSKVCY
jgi:hypothetical protein